jgi:hypothetical protein
MLTTLPVWVGMTPHCPADWMKTSASAKKMTATQVAMAMPTTMWRLTFCQMLSSWRGGRWITWVKVSKKPFEKDLERLDLDNLRCASTTGKLDAPRYLPRERLTVLADVLRHLVAGGDHRCCLLRKT